MSKGKYITRSQMINVYCGYQVGLSRNKLAEINNLSLPSIDRIIKIMLTARDYGVEVLDLFGRTSYTSMKQMACDYFDIYVRQEEKIIELKEEELEELNYTLNVAYEKFKELESQLSKLSKLVTAFKSKINN